MEVEFRVLIKAVNLNTRAVAYTSANLGKHIGSLIKELAKIIKSPLHLAGVGTRTMRPGLPLGGEGGEGGIPGMRSIPPTTPFLRHYGRLIKKGIDVEKLFEESAEFYGKMKSFSNAFISYQNEVMETLEKVREKLVTPLEKEEGKKEKATEKAKEKATEFIKAFGKRQLIKALQFGIGFLKQIVKLGTSPVMEGILEPLKALGTVLKIILIPLKPFLFILELIGKVLEAVMAPIQAALFEELQGSFEELIGVIPYLVEQVNTWIEGGGLTEVVNLIRKGISALVTALKNGLMMELIKLSMGILRLAVKIASPENLSMLVKIGKLFLTLAEALGEVLYPILNWLSNLSWGELKGILYGFGVFMATMVGLFTGGLVGMAVGAVVGAVALAPILFMQEGGEVPSTGPIFAHKGETVHKKGMDDEMLNALEEMIYLQKRILQMKEEKYR